MKTNYTEGRQANVMLNNTADGSVIWFLNVTLTKTGLSSHTRDIEASGDLISDTSLTDASGNTVGMVGMVADTRDKILNNLYPEVCQLKIPSDGTCDELWHCDDSGDNCVEMTNQGATLLANDSTTCTWELPYCEFSAWTSGEPSSGSGGTTTGGGGGGGGTTETTQITLTTAGTTYTALARNTKFEFSSEGVTHKLTLTKVSTDTTDFLLEPSAEKFTLSIGEEKTVALNSNEQLYVKLLAISTRKADLLIKKIVTKPLSLITPPSTPKEEVQEEITGAVPIEKEAEEVMAPEVKIPSMGIIVGALIVVIALIIAFVIIKRKVREF